MKTKFISKVLWKDRVTAVATVILTILIALGLFGPFLAPHPNEGRGEANIDNSYIGPSLKHILGTDELGRDLLSRIIFGTRPALVVAITVVTSAALIGTFLGLIAGFRGGLIDNLIMRVSELFLSFPPLLLSLVAVTFLGPGLDRKSTRLNSSHVSESRMPSSA